jgi:hypothetical protein
VLRPARRTQSGGQSTETHRNGTAPRAADRLHSEQRVREQEERIARLRSHGLPATLSESLLVVFKDSLKLMRWHHERLQKQLADCRAGGIKVAVRALAEPVSGAAIPAFRSCGNAT